MLDWDINHHLLQFFVKISFQVSTMIYETQIGTKNYLIMRVFFLVHYNMQTPLNPRTLSCLVPFSSINFEYPI
jgi:hypothetical protein